MHHELILEVCDCRYRSEKISILSDLIRKTNAQEMKWIVMIILKGGISIASVDFSAFVISVLVSVLLFVRLILSFLISTSLSKFRS